MRNLTYVTTHVEDGLRRLKEQFRKPGNFREFIRFYLTRIQELEDVFFTLYLKASIDAAEGELLDFLGRWAGIDRPSISTPDEVYRVLIYGRIAANNSTGRYRDIDGILGILQAVNRAVYPNFPASLTINFTPSDLIFDLVNIRRILEQATLSVELNITAHAASGAFGFSDDADALGFDEGIIGEGI